MPPRLQQYAARNKPSDSFVIYLPIIDRASAQIGPFGIDMYSGNSPEDGHSQMQAAGSRWETVYFKWSEIEPVPPVGGVHTYDWSSFDGIAARAQSAGMSLFVVFSYNPAWAADLRGGPVRPAHVTDLNSVTAAAAERYDGDGNQDAPNHPIVSYWSFYNEPDNRDLPHAQWSDKGYWGDNPSGYADMLAGVATAMHAANAQAVVLIGGVAYDWFTPGGIYVQSFMGGVLDALNAKAGHLGGAANYIGAIDFHYYPISDNVWPTIKEKTQEIRSIMTARGVGSLPVLVPEMGYWSQPVPGHPAFDSDETKQARNLVRTYVRGMSVGLQQMEWFMVFDNGTGTDASGLFRGTDLNSAKPAYAAYRALTTELGHARYSSSIAGNGLEGYVFSDVGGGPPETVVWAAGQSAAQVVFPLTCVRRVDYLGNVVTPINDGNVTWDKDSVAGQITLAVAQYDPIYVRSC